MIFEAAEKGRDYLPVQSHNWATVLAYIWIMIARLSNEVPKVEAWLLSRIDLWQRRLTPGPVAKVFLGAIITILLRDSLYNLFYVFFKGGVPCLA